jgi:oligopeptide transport system substrate-binding protein
MMPLVVSSLPFRRAVAAAVIVLSVASACNSAALTQGPRLAKSQALRVIIDDQPQTLDPGQSQYSFENAVLRVIDEPLLKPLPDMSGVTPAAAQSYEVLNNGTQYVFHLRKTAEWWDGTPVKAQDFVYAWRRLIDPRLAAPTATFFASIVFNGDKVSILDPQRDASKIDPGLQSLGLAAPDDYTFQVNLARPDPAFVWLAAMPSSAPIRQDVVAKNGDKWSGSPDTLMTNGPFKVVEITADDHLSLAPNPHYWGPKPRLTSLTFEVVKDGAAALDKFKSGGADVMDVQPAQASSLTSDSQLAKLLVKIPALTVYWIAFRVTSPRLGNSGVRLALAEAIDRQAFVDQVFQGQGQPAESFIPQGMRGYSADLGVTQRFDVAQARAELASAGVSAAQLSGLHFSYDKASDFGKATATFVHDQLKANLGVDIALDPIDANTLGSRLASGSFDMAGPLGWSADYPDPADWYDIFLTTNSNNYSLYQNGHYDDLVNVAGTDTDPIRRDQEYQQAQKQLVGDAPVAFLAQSLSWFVVQPYVHGLSTSPVDDWPGELAPAQIYLTEH